MTRRQRARRARAWGGFAGTSGSCCPLTSALNQSNPELSTGPPRSIHWVESVKMLSQTQNQKRHLIHLPQDCCGLQITSASAGNWKCKLTLTLASARPHLTRHTRSSFLLRAPGTCMDITLYGRSIPYSPARLEFNALALGPFTQAQKLISHGQESPLRKGIEPAVFSRNLHIP